MILEKVVALVSAQFNVEVKNLNLETSFRDDLNADSLDLVELIMALEDEFDLEIEDEELDTIKTVADAVEYIKQNLGEDI